MKLRFHPLALAALSLLLCLQVNAQMPRRNAMQETDPAFFKTEDALRVGDQVLTYQRVTGGWPKNIDMSRRLTDAELARVLAEKNRIIPKLMNGSFGLTEYLLITLLRFYEIFHLRNVHYLF